MFSVVRRGFDQQQVTEKINGLTARLTTEQQRADYAEQELRQALERIRELGRAGGGNPHGFGDRLEKLMLVAEQQAADTTERANQYAREIVERARSDAEAHRRDVEQTLVSRAANLDQEAARRNSVLQRRDEELAASQIAARQQAEEIRAAAERDAATVRETAQAEITELQFRARVEARAERDKSTRELARLIDMQDGVRAEMERINHGLGELREALTKELTAGGGQRAPRHPASLPPGTTARTDTLPRNGVHAPRVGTADVGARTSS